MSVEDQETADERIPHLLATPAACRMVSAEPLLGEINFNLIYDEHNDLPGHLQPLQGRFAAAMGSPEQDHRYSYDIGEKLDWIVTGGESGPVARPAQPDWFRLIRDQCQAAGVAYFHKQNGAWRPIKPTDPPVEYPLDEGRAERSGPVDDWLVRVGKHHAGRLLDGRTHDEFPEMSR